MSIEEFEQAELEVLSKNLPSWIDNVTVLEEPCSGDQFVHLSNGIKSTLLAREYFLEKYHIVKEMDLITAIDWFNSIREINEPGD